MIVFKTIIEINSKLFKINYYSTIKKSIQKVEQ